MIAREYFRASRKLLALFLLVTGIPFAGLAWLGWRLLEQDRALENQRLRERLENAASLLSHELNSALVEWEQLLSTVTPGVPVALPPGGVLLVFDSSGVLHHQGARLPYCPLVPSPPEAPASVFRAAESHEFREQDPASAATLYQSLARTRDRRLRAAALMRLARCLRKRQRIKDALAVYKELEALGETPVAGSPAELLARHERIALLRITGDEEAGQRESELLALALWEGRFRIDRTTFQFYSESLQPTQVQPNSALMLAEAVEGLWPLWQRQAEGRSAWSGAGLAVAAVWRQTSAGTVALVTDVNAPMASALPAIQDLRIRLALEDPAGRLAWGIPAKAGLQVARTSQATGLPWTLLVASADPAAEQAVSSSRRSLLVSGFALMLLVITAASYFVFRAVNRELSVARLQSDFVAAVSHEFRTPLTAMSHLTEMLEEGGTPGDRLPLYYRALGKETRRLRGMVESLLDFGRMEAGRHIYHIEDADAADLVRRVVDEFRGEVSAHAHRVQLDMPLGERRIRADGEAITRALRNLLDNAVKYSPESSTVRVVVESQPGRLAISVEDQGAGIPKHEQRRVFRKFVRGTSSRTLNVEGSGIGLSMVDHIVRAHGGRVALDSEPGRGSRFTILLPMKPERK
jgi:signal transduction histidine kinase